MHKFFDSSLSIDYPQLIHLCCYICALHCKCESIDCGKLTRFPGIIAHENDLLKDANTRLVNPEQKSCICEYLICYHKSLITSLVKKSANGQLKTLADTSLLLGFSEVQVEQVVDNCGKLCTLQDILDNVEIWD